MICPNLPHSLVIFVKVSKSIIFLVKIFLGNFIDIWQFLLVTLLFLSLFHFLTLTPFRLTDKKRSFFVTKTAQIATTFLHFWYTFIRTFKNTFTSEKSNAILCHKSLSNLWLRIRTITMKHCWESFPIRKYYYPYRPTNLGWLL